MNLENVLEFTSFDYWFNWRVLLCAIWVIVPMIVSLLVLWKYEDSSVQTQPSLNGNDVLCIDDVWRPCFERIHPGWLLGFRVLGFCFLLANNIARFANRGWRIYYYYTQWTFTLIAIYFGMGSLLSIYGCLQYKKQGNTGLIADQVGIDAENGFRSPLIDGDNMVSFEKRKTSGSEALKSYVHLFQIIYQMGAGAAVLTDSIYWTVIFPFLSLQDYEMSFMTVNLHTSNLVLLLIDTFLNRLKFPLFRFSYFILWTGCFVLFQWILHMFISVGWPYPFLNLSLDMAPVWYLLVALLHLPSYGLFALIVKIKYKLIS
ncbi:unnamed protein product [Arabidopsis thaliana]|jgi:hypothetical protein|uniref:AT3g27760/MGF10_16 n=3 Tax=Arabidopsis TaxID=3701 RepID=Q8W4R6_ARATH|nr:plant/protein [Arabidopsis thaliana]KAG7626831.1 hypothetical protein ISN45_At03g029500 [Arabidopsis thaliana x Arabidopsis arenosa]AAL31204.1 AT3g27760/MGF10_16 [Arabidopsis thaliana]AEE77361.1 plant/protein [Arabidopsis thaliana]OAP01432.1 hypothetical protein AXX17_AT3G30280 [Arabidopsis thaliana]VYS58837.1 unnamed protein product [Arabidopsis thaliana]|eukprot:NP_566825.1 plant/protein [Arabidopsis thaliana]